jgi:HAD superfamily hydrolase (TIGR01509 family)
VSDFELVIFDCDGVLVDSERITNHVFAEMLGGLGLQFTLDEMFATFMGRSMPDCLQIIETRLGRPVHDGFEAEYSQRSQAILAREVEPIDGIVSALESIDIPSCVASSAGHAKMQTTLGRTGLLERFEGRIFSAREVARGKPHPDVFLHAAEQMGAEPERCAVVEDSVNGVLAGVAARMTVFGYAQLAATDVLADAGAIVFRDMARLPELLAVHGPTA